jgi:hypothetical protein
MDFEEAVLGAECKEQANSSVAHNRSKDITEVKAWDLAKATNTETSMVPNDCTKFIAFSFEDLLGGE